MPEQTFGGDDTGGQVEEKRKLGGLSKFGLSPDSNIRDVFWRIMASYSATKKPGIDLKELEPDRFALMSAAISVLRSPHVRDYGLSPRFIVNYTVIMMLDGGWEDAFTEFLVKSSEGKEELQKNVALALRRQLENGEHGGWLRQYFKALLRQSSMNPMALRFIADIDDKELVASLKQELMIIARGDIGQNQLDAIGAISALKDDQDVKKTLIILLSHWDAEARRGAAEALKGFRKDADVREAAKRRLGNETDAEIKKILKTVAK